MVLYFDIILLYIDVLEICVVVPILHFLFFKQVNRAYRTFSAFYLVLNAYWQQVMH